MSRFVIGPDVALLLAEHRAVVPPQHRLLAPTLLRSQVLAQLYADVQAGRLLKQEAAQRLDHLRVLNIRLLGDRSLQQQAWAFAEKLQWADTFVAEYMALTKLQGDALVLRDPVLTQMLRGVVPLATLEDLLEA